MMPVVKDFIRKTLLFFHLDLTRNLRYDRLADVIYNNVLKPGMNIIDIGAHKGEVLETLIKRTAGGLQFAFEPIPELADKLKIKFPDVQVHSCALASTTGEVSFQYVKNAPAYSGLKRRKYAVKQPDIQEIKVKCLRLDDVIPPQTRIDLIKIDTEGAELEVLKGAPNLLKKHSPVLLFEFGLGSSEYYNAGPDDMFNYLKSFDYNIYSLENYINGKAPYNIETFRSAYQSNKEYYFVAEVPKRSY